MQEGPLHQKFSDSLIRRMQQHNGIYLNEATIQNQPLYKVTQKQMKSLIHRLVCAIKWSRGSQLKRFSGILISANLVLTCAHGLYDKINKDGKSIYQRVKDSEIEVYPAPCGKLNKPLRVQISFIPKEYQINQIAECLDFALLKITERVERSYFIPLNSNFAQKKGAEIAIFGYPASKFKLIDKKQAKYAVNQWGLIRKDRVTEINLKQRKIYYEISTEPGQSGSGIILVENERLSIVGVHKCVNTNYKNNIGVLTTNQMLQTLRFQANLFKAEMFKETSAAFDYNQQQADVIINNSGFEVFQEEKKSIQNFLIKKGWVNSKLQLALKYYQHKQFQSAVIECLSALKVDEQSSEANFILGQIYFQNNLIPQAKTHLEQAIQLNTAYLQPYMDLGLIYFFQEQFQKAIMTLQKVVQIDPSVVYTYYFLAQSYKNLEQYEQAVSMYALVPKQDKHYLESLINLGKIYQRSQKIGTARACFRKAIQAKPNDDRAYTCLGSLQLLSSPIEANEYLQRAILLNPKSFEAYLYLAKLYLKASKWSSPDSSKARQFLMKAIELQQQQQQPNSQLSLQLGNFYYDFKNIRQAKNSFINAVEQNPNNKQAWNRLGEALMITKQVGKAIQAFTKALQVDSNYFVVYYNLGKCWQIQQNYSSAIAYFQQFLDFDKNNKQVRDKISQLQKKK